MAKQIKSLTTMNVKIEQTEHVKMEKSSQEQNNTMVEVRIILNSIVSISFSFSKALSKLIEDPLTDENDKVKYIYKRIYINYEKKNWSSKFNYLIILLSCLFFVSDVIEDISMYQQITKSKKLNLLKL